MRTVFSQLDVWENKESVSITSSKKEPIILLRICKDSVVINPENFTGADLISLNPTDEASKKTIALKNYLDENNIELFQICVVGGTFNNIVKPKDISLAEYLKI